MVIKTKIKIIDFISREILIFTLNFIRIFGLSANIGEKRTIKVYGLANDFQRELGK